MTRTHKFAHLGERVALHRHVLLFDAMTSVGHLLQVPGQETPRLLVGEAGRIEKAPDQVEPARLQAGFLDELAGGRALRRLPRDVAPTGRYLQQFAVQRCSVLADKDDLAGALVNGDSDHRTRVMDQVPLEALAAGALESPLGHVEQASLVDGPLAYLVEFIGGQYRPLLQGHAAPSAQRAVGRGRLGAAGAPRPFPMPLPPAP